jgi:hypothetical protein
MVVVCLMSALIILAGDEFRKDPLTISFAHTLDEDFGIGWDLILCSHISSRAPSGGNDAMLRCLLPSWDMLFFISMEKTVVENAIRLGSEASDGKVYLCGYDDLAWWFLTCSSDIDNQR